MLVDTTGRFTSSLRTERRVVFPQRFSGDSMPMYVLTSRNLNRYVWRTQRARVSAAHVGRIRKHLSRAAMLSRRALPFTGPGQGSISFCGSTEWDLSRLEA